MSDEGVGSHGGPVRRSYFDLEVSVARIEGMLTATLTRHDQRLDQHEGTLRQHQGRLTEKGNTIARHDERIKALEEDNSARLGRVTGVIGTITALVAVAIAVFNRIQFI